jgi:hypothetical protein
MYRSMFVVSCWEVTACHMSRSVEIDAFPENLLLTEMMLAFTVYALKT